MGLPQGLPQTRSFACSSTLAQVSPLLINILSVVLNHYYIRIFMSNASFQSVFKIENVADLVFYSG